MTSAESNDRFGAARAIIRSGLASRAYPAAVVEVGRHDAPLWREPFGRLSYEPRSPACTLETIFDLASLTKVIATASLAMRAIASNELSLNARVSEFSPDFARPDRDAVTVRHLLDHSSGLPGYARIFEHASGRTEFEQVLYALASDYPAGTKSVYSDPGFILLGFILERARHQPLDRQFNAMSAAIGEVWYGVAYESQTRVAPTENDPWRGRVLQAEVHDENAAVLGGVAAHAGLFGTASAVGAFARIVLETFHRQTILGPSELMREFATRSAVPGSSRALAWDTMLPTSSCGTRMSRHAIGHTGFTGTSLWIDPDRDLYVVFLTNRVHPTRTNEQLIGLRPKLHDEIVAAVTDLF